MAGGETSMEGVSASRLVTLKPRRSYCLTRLPGVSVFSALEGRTLSSLGGVEGWLSGEESSGSRGMILGAEEGSEGLLLWLSGVGWRWEATEGKEESRSWSRNIGEAVTSDVLVKRCV